MKLCIKCNKNEIYNKRRVCDECLRNTNIARSRKWYKENRDYVIQKAKEYQSEHKEIHNKSNQKWRSKNRDVYLQKKREYTKTDRYKELSREYGNKRRGLIAKSKVNFTKEELKALFEKYDYRCIRCFCKPKRLEADHIMPLSKGGTNSIENIQPLCITCNRQKHTKYVDYRRTALRIIQYLKAAGL